MKKRLIMLYVSAFVILVFSQCFILFENPLGNERIKIKKKMAGIWQMNIKFGKNSKTARYLVTAQKNNTVKIKTLNERKANKDKKKRKRKSIWGYAIEYDKQVYLHLYKPEKKEDGFQIFPIEIVSDKEIKLRVFSPKKIKAMVEKKAMKAEQKKKMLTMVKESTESMRALIKNEGLENLLADETYTLKKVKK